MSIPDPSLSGFSSFPNIARMATRGSRLATVVSAFALAFSGVSFYETVMKQPQLSAYVPPVLHYGQDSSSESEVFAIPITIANNGARTGTVLSLELAARNTKTGAELKFYSAYFGDHPRVADTTPRAFAPLSIQGRSTFSDTVRFYPIGSTRPFVLEDAGDVEFKLTFDLIKPGHYDVLSWVFRTDPQPLVFTRHLPWYSSQQLSMHHLAIAMKQPGWTPVPQPSETEVSPPKN